MKKKAKKNKSIILRVMILGVCVYMIATLAGLLNKLNESKAKLNKLKEEYKTEQNDIAELKTLLSEGSETRIIEKAARERLGYVFSDEQVFIDISGS